jgi:hypothetical protein
MEKPGNEPGPSKTKGEKAMNSANVATATKQVKDKELLQLWVGRELQRLLHDAVLHDRLFHKDKILANIEGYHYSRQDCERVIDEELSRLKRDYPALAWRVIGVA